MKKYPNSGALITGLILITLGVIFLVENFYAPFSAWRLLSRYWPVILIIIGLNKICAYFIQQPKNQPEVSDKTPPKE